jgi:hypothetical protein
MALVAGFLSKRKFLRFWGDTVNTASRMETSLFFGKNKSSKNSKKINYY